MHEIAASARQAAFTPVDGTARVDAVVGRLTDAIQLGLVADGEQLPSEAELAVRLGVSTVTLREALMALRQQGLVETRRGRAGGSFVRVPRDDFAGAHRRPAELSADELRDLGDHYAAIAGAAARLAARRSAPADLAPLRRTLAAMAAAATPAAARRLHGRFHVEVAAASRSARLAQEEIRLQAQLGGTLWLPGGTHRADHEAIVEAVARGDGDLARALAERHAQAAVDRLLELR